MKRKSTFFSRAAWADRRLLQKLHTIYTSRAKVTDYIMQPVSPPKVTPFYWLFPVQPAGYSRGLFMPSYSGPYFTTS